MRRAGRRGVRPWAAGSQGFALVTVLTLTMVLALLSALTMNASSSFLNQTVTPYVRTVKATYVAEGGAQLAFQWLKSNYWLLNSSYLTTSNTSGALLLSSNSTAPTLPGNHPDPYTDTGSATRSGVVTSFNNTLTSKTLGDGTFSATATLLGTSPEQWSVVSTGTVSGVSRTVTLRVRRGPYSPDDAVVTDGDLTMNGNPTVNGTKGSVHTNEDLSLSGNPTIAVNATASDDYSATGHPTIGGVAGGSQPQVAIPAIVPSDYRQYATYELRSDGLIYCGQAGPANGTCTTVGALLTGVLSGWVYNAVQGRWTKSGNTAADGAFYVQGDVSISGNPGSPSVPWQVTIIATGYIDISGNPDLQSYTQNLLFIAGTDIQISGNFTQHGSEAVIAAHEQISISGNPTILGTILAQDAATASNKVTSNRISGNPTITYNGTLGPNPLPGPLKVVARSERS